MTVQYTPAAVRDLRKLGEELSAQVRDALAEFTPGTRHPQVTALKNAKGVFRMRVGEYRAIFEMDGGTVTVTRVRHRKEVYR